jgi:hypothetical protein
MIGRSIVWLHSSFHFVTMNATLPRRVQLAAGFSPSQVVLIPLDCYSGEGPINALKLIATVAGLPADSVGKSIGDLDKGFRHENSKRLERVAAEARRKSESSGSSGGGGGGIGKKNKDKGRKNSGGNGGKRGSGAGPEELAAAVMNNHGEKAIPVPARRALAMFFKHDLEDLAALISPTASSSLSSTSSSRTFVATAGASSGGGKIHVLECERCHFMRPCNATACLPSFEQRLRTIAAEEQAWAAENQHHRLLQHHGTKKEEEEEEQKKRGRGATPRPRKSLLTHGEKGEEHGEASSEEAEERGDVYAKGPSDDEQDADFVSFDAMFHDRLDELLEQMMSGDGG